ncbi:MAG: YciI family protein [Gemmatimonadota bacterium]|nr:YciI family protein [Gemmatimonadota bacterium]
MRFMMIIKATDASERGEMPSAAAIVEMGKFNQQLIDAGVLLAADGLQPSSKGARVHLSGDKRTVVDGPFAETKELVGGFWILQLKSLDEAVQWARRCPNPQGAGDCQIEVRQVFDAADFAPILADSPEGREVMKQEKEFRQRTGGSFS